MKATKLILSILFIFSSVEGFSQIIQDTAICATIGSSASFTVDVSGETYVWQMKSPGSQAWTPIDSSTPGSVYTSYNTATLNIKKSATLPVTGTLYKVIVNNGSNTSNEATLIVDPEPTSKIISGASPVCAGGSKTLTYGTGSVGTIQWQSSSTSNPEDFYDIDGETVRTYIATDLQETTWFRVMNSSGECGSIYSPAVQVVVNPLVVAGNIDGGDINVCNTLNSTELTLYNYEGTIQWQKALDAFGAPGSPGEFSNILLANIDKYTASTLTATTYFRAVLSSGVCASETTDPVVIIVDPKPVSKLVTGASTICIGESKTLAYGTGSVGEILWQYSTTSNSENFYDIDGETERIYTASDLQETTWFRVMNSSGECGSVYSPAVQVVVNPLAVAGNIDGGDINVCKTQNATTLTLYNYEGSIQWQKAPDLGGAPGKFSTIDFATSATYLAAALTATTYFRALVSSGVCASETTDPVLITVDPLPISKIITGASPACMGGSKVLIYGKDSLGDIQWQYSTTSSSAGFDDINGETELVYLASDLQETTWFRVKNTNGTCSSVYSTAVQVLINSPAVSGIIEGGNNIVSKSSNATELTLNGYKGTIQWQKAASLTDTYTDITSSISSTYLAKDLTDNTYFRALVSSGVCSKVATEPVFIKVDSEFKVTTFPNPFETEFNLNLTSLSLDPIELKIYDMLGRLIENHQIKSSEINSMRIGTTYPPGFFTVLIKQGQQERDVKVLKK